MYLYICTNLYVHLLVHICILLALVIVYIHTYVCVYIVVLDLFFSPLMYTMALITNAICIDVHLSTLRCCFINLYRFICVLVCYNNRRFISNRSTVKCEL